MTIILRQETLLLTKTQVSRMLHQVLKNASNASLHRLTCALQCTLCTVQLAAKLACL